MKHTFTAQMDGGPDRWLLFYGQHPAGEVFWIRVLDHPTHALERMCEGLNGVHGSQPPTAWTATLAQSRRWDLLEQGDLVGELAWTNDRMRDPDRWTQRALDGLNATPVVQTTAVVS